MALFLALRLAAAVLLALMPSCWAAPPPPPRANVTAPALRGGDVTPSSAASPESSRMGTVAAAAAGGSCTAADETKMAGLGAGSAAGSFPGVVAQCGKDSWSLFGGFHTADYVSCIVSSTGLTRPCAQCFSSSGVYGYRHCKFQCLFGSWCGGSCLRCVESSTQEVRDCAGVPIPDATAC